MSFTPNILSNRLFINYLALFQLPSLLHYLCTVFAKIREYKFMLKQLKEFYYGTK